MSAENDDDKSYEPTQRRLDEARKRGEIPASADLYGAASLAGLLVAGLIFGPNAVSKTGLAAQGLLDGAERLAPRLLSAPDAPLAGIGFALLWPLAPFLGFPLVFVLVMAALQQALVLAPDRIMPKLSRISPFANAKHKFGREGLFQFGKSAVKLGITGALLVAFTLSKAEEVLTSLRMTPAQSTVTMLGLMMQFLMLALLVSATIGAIDYGWQALQHLMRNRMSRKELVDEMKDSEGDPYTKAKRRQRGQEIAMNQMLADVAKADVVIVNPTHYAVALKWKRGDKSAPICLAKGVDDIAAKIRERAAEHGVALHRDPPTARAIYATVDVGKPIRHDHYKAVAAAIRFAEAMRKKARGWNR